MRQFGYFLISLILLIGLVGCSPSAPEPTPEETTRIHAGDAAPNFEGHFMDGTPFSLEAQRGKVVVLAFFATWCPPCREELPHLESDVWQRFEGPNFAMVAIGREHQAEEMTDFITQMGITFPVIPDPDRSIFSLYADAFIPRTVVINREGRVIYHGTDFDLEVFGEMVELIESTLAVDGPEAEDLATEEPETDN